MTFETSSQNPLYSTIANTNASFSEQPSVSSETKNLEMHQEIEHIVAPDPLLNVIQNLLNTIENVCIFFDNKFFECFFKNYLII